MTLIGVEWLQEVAVTFVFLFFVFTLIWGPPNIILPRAPQSVRPSLTLILHSLPQSEPQSIFLQATVRTTYGLSR